MNEYDDMLYNLHHMFHITQNEVESKGRKLVNENIIIRYFYDILKK